MQNTPFHDPVTVEEMSGGRLEFYRVYDGISHHTALTLGRSWFERSVLESVWSAAAKLQGKAREDMLMDLLRSANFIHPQWNNMTDIACMQVPSGSWVVVVRGKGSWKAMQSKPIDRRSCQTSKPQVMSSTCTAACRFPAPTSA